MIVFKWIYYIGLLSCIALLYGYLNYGGIDGLYKIYLEILDNYYLGFENLDDFYLSFYFYIYLFLSFFSFMWGGFMSSKFKMVYLPIVMSAIFFSVGYYSETVRFGFYLSAIILLGISIFFITSIPILANQISLFKFINDKKNKKFKENGIEVNGEFVKVITNYGLKINKRPAEKAVFKVRHPLLDKDIFVESGNSFDPYFSINVPKTVKVYFDKYNEKKYLCDLTIN